LLFDELIGNAESHSFLFLVYPDDSALAEKGDDFLGVVMGSKAFDELLPERYQIVFGRLVVLVDDLYEHRLI
jgi:hypothetical protein